MIAAIAIGTSLAGCAMCVLAAAGILRRCEPHVYHLAAVVVAMAIVAALVAG